MAQYGRPSSDITNNTWTTLPTGGQTLYAQVDEASYSDTDYVRSTGSQTMEVKLSSLTDPVSSVNHVLRLRAKATGSSAAEKWTVTLYQGTTLIATAFSASNVTRTTFNLYSYSLTAAQIDAITDYSDLRVRIATTAAAGETIDVSWIELEVPDAIVIHDLSANGIVSGTPVLNTAEIGQTHILGANGVLSGTPVLNTPTLTAQSSIIVDLDHEVGNLTEYNTTVTNGDRLSVTQAAALAGSNYGLQQVIANTVTMYGEVNGLNSTTGRFRIRFYIDLNDLSMVTTGIQFGIMCFRNTANGRIGLARLYKRSDGIGLDLGIYNDSIVANYPEATPPLLTDEPHYVEALFVRATNSTSADGYMNWWVDGVEKTAVTGIDNYDQFPQFGIYRVGSGLDIAVPSAMTGTFFMDEIVINNSGSYIGPVSAGEDSLTANGIVSGTPVLGASTLGQKHILSANGIVSGIPVLGISSIGQKHILSGNGIVSGIPVLGISSIGQKHILSGNEIVSGVPVLGISSIGQKYILSANGILAGIPVLVGSTLGQKHALLASTVSSGTPVLDSPAIGQKHTLSGNGILSGIPVLVEPSIGQKHILSTNGITSGLPVLENPVFNQNLPDQDNLIANSIISGIPVISSPNFSQEQELNASSIVCGVPSIGHPVFSQKQNFIASNISSGVPTLGHPVLTEQIFTVELEANDILAGSPILEETTISQIHNLTGVSITSGLPICSQTVLSQVHVLDAVSILSGLPILGIPEFKSGFIKPDSLSLIETKEWELLLVETKPWTIQLIDSKTWELLVSLESYG